jgi:hypothetical protein
VLSIFSYYGRIKFKSTTILERSGGKFKIIISFRRDKVNPPIKDEVARTIITDDQPEITINVEQIKGFSQSHAISLRIQPEHQFKISGFKRNGFTSESVVRNGESFRIDHFSSPS